MGKPRKVLARKFVETKSDQCWDSTVHDITWRSFSHVGVTGCDCVEGRRVFGPGEAEATRLGYYARAYLAGITQRSAVLPDRNQGFSLDIFH